MIDCWGRIVTSEDRQCQDKSRETFLSEARRLLYNNKSYRIIPFDRALMAILLSRCCTESLL